MDLLKVVLLLLLLLRKYLPAPMVILFAMIPAMELRL